AGRAIPSWLEYRRRLDLLRQGELEHQCGGGEQKREMLRHRRLSRGIERQSEGGRELISELPQAQRGKGIEPPAAPRPEGVRRLEQRRGGAGEHAREHAAPP